MTGESAGTAYECTRDKKNGDKVGGDRVIFSFLLKILFKGLALATNFNSKQDILKRSFSKLQIWFFFYLGQKVNEQKGK